MILFRITVCLGLAVFVLGRAAAAESNYWPVRVAEKAPDGSVESWTELGPIIFNEPSPAGGRVAGFRPFFVRWTDPAGETRESTVLYPIFYYRSYGDSFKWSIFNLINRFGGKGDTPPTPDTDSRTFDIWPIYFSRETGDPATSYHSVLPIAGTIFDLLGYDSLHWILFPLYVQTNKKGAVTTYTPWPIVRSTRGAATGFAVWPLFGHEIRPGAYDRSYLLWPLVWNNTVQPGPDAAPGTPGVHQIGVLPFYSGEHGPDVTNENYFLFFGNTYRLRPYRYHETRYFWPFLVQGSGDDRTVDRWGPFYSHSVIRGIDKTWYLWPLVRRTRWVDGDVAQDKTQFLYFFYWRQEQRSLRNPAAAAAEKTYLWPLFSSWDNGAGRRQVQILSPFEGVFADNDEVRQTWSPFFALWRYDQRAPGEVSASLLWNAVTWKESAATGHSEFHFGPLFSMSRGPSGRRFSLGGGLIGFQRGRDDRGWRLFCLEFSSRHANLSSAR